MLFQILLITHLVGFTLMTGATLAEYLLFHHFIKRFRQREENAPGILPLIKKLSVMLVIGGPLLIVSGTGMMLLTHGVFMTQLWLQVKLALVLVLVVNGFLVGGRQELKLKKCIAEYGVTPGVRTEQAIRGMRLFYAMQLMVFLLIVVLVVCRFQ